MALVSLLGVGTVYHTETTIGYNIHPNRQPNLSCCLVKLYRPQTPRFPQPAIANATQQMPLKIDRQTSRSLHRTIP
jgi:hypothetical protein